MLNFIKICGDGALGGGALGGGALGGGVSGLGKLFGNSDFKEVFEGLKKDLEDINLDRSKMGHDMMGGRGLGCVIGGGAGVAMISSVIGYMCFITLVVLILMCLLGYIFYLKNYNNCDNKNCCFSFEYGFVDQIKTDVFTCFKNMVSCLLKESISVIKNGLNIVNITFDVYEKGASRLISHINSEEGA